MLNKTQVAISALFALPFATVAQTAPDPSLEAPAKPSSVAATPVPSTTANSLDRFKFGVALGFENYKGGGYVNEAETVGDGRVVQVTDQQSRRPSLWFETHYIWDGFANKVLGRTHSAPGFYIGVRALGGDGSLFDAFSLGLLWSFKRTALFAVLPADQIAESINIGIGPVWHRTRRLAKGIQEGQPLPSDFQDVKFTREDEISWMLMVSVGF